MSFCQNDGEKLYTEGKKKERNKDRFCSSPYKSSSPLLPVGSETEYESLFRTNVYCNRHRKVPMRINQFLQCWIRILHL